MERAAWIVAKRRMAEQRYDTLFAATFDQEWGHINASHRAMLQRFLALCPARATILDAACGTGKYWPLLLEQGFQVHGIDQSQEMLALAQRKFPAVRVEKMGLQEIAFAAAFPGIICMDAMENVFPEHWPLVLANFFRALTLQSVLYFTVEIADPAEIAAAFTAGQQNGLPVVPGEWAHGGGYHYYPSLKQVRAWLDDAHFDLLAETTGDDYAHFIARKQI